MRELILNEMTDEWKAAYEAGIFTEFMEQRAPGHTVLDDKIYRKGHARFPGRDRTPPGRAGFPARPRSLRQTGGTERHAHRRAGRSSALGRDMPIWRRNRLRRSPIRRGARSWKKFPSVCRNVPAHAPSDLHEALQYYWFVHLGVTTELNTWDAFCPGKLDQHLLPFYDPARRDEAEELLHCFWIKFNNQPAPPKVGVTAAESGTYTDFAQINVGGLRPDGSDGVNEVSYLLLDVIEDMRLLQPSSSVQVSKKNPDRFVRRAARIIRTGFGQPSIFNSDLIVQELVRMGKTCADARCGGSIGCVEVGAFGKEAYIFDRLFQPAQSTGVNAA